MPGKNRVEEFCRRGVARRALAGIAGGGRRPLGHCETLTTVAKIAGPAIHDARIVALCVAHGVSELWSADRDIARFAGLKTRNPLA